MMKKILAKCYIWILLILLYAPILFIAVFSFTESKVLGKGAPCTYAHYHKAIRPKV